MLMYQKEFNQIKIKSKTIINTSANCDSLDSSLDFLENEPHRR